jgi:hydroxymethylglutaryl-CoA lyase
MNTTDVRIHEVAPRDGLQNESRIVSTRDKLKLIDMLLAAGVDSIEIGSFVRADLLPQLADTAELASALAASPGDFYALLANQRGLDDFLATDLAGVTVLVSASEQHSKANVGMSRERAMAESCRLIERAGADSRAVRAYVSMACGCPYQGEVAPESVFEVVTGFAAAGAALVVIADTLGVGRPEQVEHLIAQIRQRHPDLELGLHMHDTHGRALVNCRVGYELGIRHFDAAVGGCGGCPFAPGSAGNLDTLELVGLLDELGASHRVDRHRLSLAGDFLRQCLGDRI